MFWESQTRKSGHVDGCFGATRDSGASGLAFSCGRPARRAGSGPAISLAPTARALPFDCRSHPVHLGFA